MTREEKEKALAKWRWEARLLQDYVLRQTVIGNDDPVLRHSKIVQALAFEAERELS